MKAIMLDVDGVLNDTHTTTRIGSWDFVDDDKVARLANVVQRTDAKLVLSSDWRFLPTTKYEGIEKDTFDTIWTSFISKLSEYGLHLYGATGEYNWSRGLEILEYLEEHPEIDRWIAIDDIANLGPAEHHHVWTNPNEGLTPWAAEEVVRRLNYEDNY